MSGWKHAEGFRDLILYQKSRQLQHEIFKVTKSFPREKMFSLTEQIRRSSRSTGAYISESGQSEESAEYLQSLMIDPLMTDF
jgi:four helix bundle protein